MQAKGAAHEFLSRQGPRRGRHLRLRGDRPRGGAAHGRSRRRLFACAARCPRRVRAWSGRSSSSIISARRNSAPAPGSTCGRIRISGLPPSPICSTARSCTATPRHRGGDQAGRGQLDDRRAAASCIPSAPAPSCAPPAARSTACRCGWRCRRRKRKWTPAFAHHDGREFPLVRGERQERARGGRLALWRDSPVPTVHETMFADVALRPGATLPLDADHEERAIYVVDGDDRYRRRQIRARPAAGVQAGRQDHRHGARPTRIL